mgnify:CR=1 FL=1
MAQTRRHFSQQSESPALNSSPQPRAEQLVSTVLNLLRMSAAAVDKTSSDFTTRPRSVRPEENNLGHNDTGRKNIRDYI